MTSPMRTSCAGVLRSQKMAPQTAAGATVHVMELGKMRSLTVPSSHTTGSAIARRSGRSQRSRPPAPWNLVRSSTRESAQARL